MVVFPPFKHHTFRVRRNFSRIVAYIYSLLQNIIAVRRSGSVSHREEQKAWGNVPLTEADIFK